MGNVFRRRRQPTEELDEIVKQLRELETQVKGHIDGRADTLRTLIFAAVGLWGAGSAYAWLHFRPLTHRLGALSVALLVSVLMFIGLRLLCMSSYDFIIERKRRRIEYYTERRVTIIEDVKENEKFKVAKEIIEKYGSEADLNRLFNPATNATDPALPHNTPSSSIKRQTSDTAASRGRSASGQAPNGQSSSSSQPSAQFSASVGAFPVSRTAQESDGNGGNSNVMAVRVPLPRLHEMATTRRFARTPVRPFVEPSSNPIDRILDYVMGESINNRYALICVTCRAHNGMALREEFEQVSYFCFKCGAYNPSRNEMRATADGIQRRNSGGNGARGISPFRRPSFSTDVRTYNGPSRTPSIRSLSAITGREDDDYSAVSTATNGSESGGNGAASTTAVDAATAVADETTSVTAQSSSSDMSTSTAKAADLVVDAN